jgi:hypothetical protein
MSAIDYAEIRAEAEIAIAEAGQTAQIRRSSRSGTAYDPIITTTDHDCLVVEVGYTIQQIDGTRIMAGDKRLFVSTAGLSITPTESDALVIGGVAHEIVRVAPLSPAGTVVFWEIQARI